MRNVVSVATQSVAGLSVARLSLAGALAVLIGSSAASAEAPSAGAQWPSYGGNAWFQRYSPSDQINKTTISGLDVVWKRPTVDPSITAKFPDLQASNYNRGTPIMVDGVLYVADALGIVEAFDGKTGKTLWVQKPTPFSMKEAAGQGTRGVAFWAAGTDRRIISQRGNFMYATHADSGEPVAEFGDQGKVFVRWPTSDPINYRTSSGPIIANDVIIIGGVGGSVDGGGTGDLGSHKEAVPENIRGYDVRTGHLLWTFHIIPDEGQPGHETWGKDSWRIVGDMGAWAPLSADEAMGLVYVPLTAPTLSYFGGHRPGDNTWSSSLVALDTRTGKLAWGKQLVHHDLWDYDVASPPVLADVKVKGALVKAVIQVNKTGNVFVFDRKTGAPVWPIEERPVPKSTVPGEAASPTQPFSVQFPPIDEQGITDADLADFTPAIKAEARDLVSHYVTGPIYTPPSLIDIGAGKLGTLEAPGGWGAGNWNSGAFDPETGVFYAVSRNLPDVFGLYKTGSDATIEYAVTNPRDILTGAGFKPGLPSPVYLKSGLPVLKPPYGRVSAYDIGAGKRLWTAPNGDDPKVRDNPALKGVKLPPLLGNTGRGAPLVTRSLLFLADASDAVSGGNGVHDQAKLRAYDKASGDVVWQHDLPAGATGAPMTFMADGRQYIIVPVGAAGHTDGWVAFALK